MIRSFLDQFYPLSSPASPGRRALSVLQATVRPRACVGDAPVVAAAATGAATAVAVAHVEESGVDRAIAVREQRPNDAAPGVPHVPAEAGALEALAGLE